MAKKRAVKKSGKKKPLRKAGPSKQAKKPIGRKAPAGKGGGAARRKTRARKTGARSGLSATDQALRTILKAGMD